MLTFIPALSVRTHRNPHGAPRCRRVASFAAKQGTQGSPGSQGASTNRPTTSPVNIKQLKSQRSLISGDKRDVSAEEVNALMIKAGKDVRITLSFAVQSLP